MPRVYTQNSGCICVKSVTIVLEMKGLRDQTSHKFSLTDHGGATSQRCFGSLEEVVSRHHPIAWFLEAGVDINAPWYYHPAMSLNGLHTTGHNEILTNLPVRESYTNLRIR